jgi:hypothetical protein
MKIQRLTTRKSASPPNQIVASHPTITLVGIGKTTHWRKNARLRMKHLMMEIVTFFSTNKTRLRKTIRTLLRAKEMHVR